MREYYSRMLPGLLLCLLWILYPVPGFTEDLSPAIEGLLQHYAPELSGRDWRDHQVGEKQRWLCEIYQEQAYKPLWIKQGKLSEEGKVVYEILRQSMQHGLDPALYNVDEISSLLSSENVEELGQLDIALTGGLLRYMHDINNGRIEARQAFPELFAEAGEEFFNPCAVLSHLPTNPNLRQYLLSMGPTHLYYRQLQKALTRYCTFAKNGGWPVIRSGQTIRPGQEDVRLPLIRKRLQITGELPVDRLDDHVLFVYDEPTVQAVKRFQDRHGLEVDGLIGRNTLAAMNVSVAKRIEQIELNLERWRWQDHNLGEKYVLVNIAGFHLKAVNNNHMQLELPVIVGKQHHETPVFSNKIKYVEFNPFWNVTPNIAANEMLPELRKNPDYLSEHRIRIFSNWQHDAVEIDPLSIDWQRMQPEEMRRYRLRQDPGEWNALGNMKFVFPNKYAVYMHDTPHQNLFNKAVRAFSHGCIRVNNPASLALFLLQGQEEVWEKETVDAVVASGERSIVVLSKKIPVHITYLTAWHDREGLLHFNRDIYERDARLSAVLNGRNTIKYCIEQ